MRDIERRVQRLEQEYKSRKVEVNFITVPFGESEEKKRSIERQMRDGDVLFVIGKGYVHS